MYSKALVIGGSGFIGSHLLNLLQEMPDVKSITSVDIAEPNKALTGVKYAIHDAREDIPRELADPDTIIFNLAGLRTFPGHTDQEYFDTNIGTSHKIVELAEATGCREILFTSTMSVYPTGDAPQTETSQLDPGNAYGKSKQLAEFVHDDWLSRDNSRRLVICRPAVIFGLGDNGNFTRLANALRAGYFVYVGRKNTIKSAGYVKDLVQSFIYSLEKGERRLVYNFSYPQRLTISDIVAAFCSTGGFRRPVLMLPMSVLTLLALPFEALNGLGMRNPIHRNRLRKLTESTNIVPEWLEKAGFPFQSTLGTALAEWRDESPQGRFR